MFTLLTWLENQKVHSRHRGRRLGWGSSLNLFVQKREVKGVPSILVGKSRVLSKERKRSIGRNHWKKSSCPVSRFDFRVYSFLGCYNNFGVHLPGIHTRPLIQCAIYPYTTCTNSTELLSFKYNQFNISRQKIFHSIRIQTRLASCVFLPGN